MQRRGEIDQFQPMLLEDLIHLLLHDSPNPLRSDEVRGADGFIHIAANFAQRIIQVSDPA